MQRVESPILAVPSETKGDVVDRPHVIWWLVVLGGLAVLAFQGFDPAFYAWWTAHMHALPPQTYMAWLFVACVPIHVAEAIYCHRLATRIGMPRSARGWAMQTLALGFPSTALLRKRARAAAARR
jgi:hypothetical protein